MNPPELEVAVLLTGFNYRFYQLVGSMSSDAFLFAIVWSYRTCATWRLCILLMVFFFEASCVTITITASICQLRFPKGKTAYEPWETCSQGSGQMLLGVCTQTGCHLVADGWFEDGGWMTKMDAADISLLVSSLLSNQETTTLWCDIIVHHQAIIYLVHKEAHMLLSSSILLYMTLAEQNLANRFGRSFIMYIYIYMYTVVTQSHTVLDNTSSQSGILVRSTSSTY